MAIHRVCVAAELDGGSLHGSLRAEGRAVRTPLEQLLKDGVPNDLLIICTSNHF
jgi:hypothetical protein